MDSKTEEQPTAAGHTRGAQTIALLAFGGVIAVSALAAWGPRLVWTVMLPGLPLAIVVFGFHRWRRACPVAAISDAGRSLRSRFGRSPKGPPRAPRVWTKNPMTAAMFVLVVCLVVRLVATNGDGPVLASFLLGLAAVAFTAGAWFGGRAFCHYVCPVGVVERIYTDGASPIVAGVGDSGCTSCSGCVSACADIDQDRGFARTTRDDDRRRATYAFPGIVFAFYGYYALRGGGWEAYFDGGWTDRVADLELLAGAGFAFAPWVPAWLAASATLALGGVLSAVSFALVERTLPHRWDALRRRQVTLALASLAAFVTFYTFAGAPTLRLLPGATRVVLLLTTAAATLLFAVRWRAARAEAGSVAEVVVLRPEQARRHLRVVGSSR